MHDQTYNDMLFSFTCRGGCMCLLCWTILQQEHRFSLECLLRPSASRGSMVRKVDWRKEMGKHLIHCFMASKADSLLRR